MSTNSPSTQQRQQQPITCNFTRPSGWFHQRCAMPLLQGLAAIVAFAALNAPAAITFDAASTGSGANPSSGVSWSHTVGAGADRMLVVGVVAERNTDASYATGVTYGSQALTRVTGSSATGSGTPYNTSDLWYLPAPNVGTANITITFATSQSNGLECGAVSLFGVKQSAPEAVAIATGAATGTTFSLAITTLTNAAWLVDVVNHGSGALANTINTTTAGMTRRWNSAVGGQLVGACSTREVATAGTVTDTWSTSAGVSSRLAQSIAAFAPAATVYLATTYTETFDSMGAAGTTAPNGWSFCSMGASSGTWTDATGVLASGFGTPTFNPTLGVATPPSASSGTAGINAGLAATPADRSLATAPTGTNGSALQLSVTNSSGGPLPGVYVGYDTRRFTVGSADNELPGYWLLYSLDNGTTWTNVAALNPTLASVPNTIGVTTTPATHITFSSALANAGTVLLLWVDDNAVQSSPDQIIGLDNVTLSTTGSNSPPTVAITSPANNATVGTSFTISASAADSDGTIASVKFYDGTTLLTTATTSPYSYAWSGATPGSHALTAVALDNGGLTTTSAVVNVTVSNNSAPSAPVTVSPGNGATGLGTSVTPTVTVTDPNGDPMTVTFFGRANSVPTPGPDFTVTVLPDTQFYSQDFPATFTSQTTWVVNNRVARNIVYLTGLGDVANVANDAQYQVATAAYAILENPLTTGLPQGIPFGVPVGNHDSYDTPSYGYFGTYFPVSRFSGRAYYGGNYTTGYRNHYDLFSASGLDFIVLSLEFNAGANSALMTWANGILAANSNRRAIVVTHSLLQAGYNWPTPAAWSTDGGTTTFPALSANPNVFLMLCGHNHGQGRRHEVGGSGYIDVLLSDWQDDGSGGSGFLRTLEFSPANNLIRIKTYSPTTGGSKTDADNEFTLPYTMTAAVPAFTVIGTNSTVPSGTQTSVTWSGLSAGTTYEWYAVANDGSLATTGATNQFVTQGAGPTPTVTLGLSGSPMAEAGGVATVTATLSAASAQPVTVNLAFSGTATLTSDYTRSATNIVIPAGSTTGSITLTAVQDAVYDPNETIIVDIDTVVNATESGTQQVTATITDDDPPPAAISFDAASSSSGTSVSSLTWSHTVGSGANRMLVVGVTYENSATTTVSGVTFGGVALTRVNNSWVEQGTSAYNGSELWYLATPASGSGSIVVSYSATVSSAIAGATSLAGVAQSGPEVVATNLLASDTTLTCGITTLTDGAWVVDVVNHGKDSSVLTATGPTKQWGLNTAAHTAAGGTRLVPTHGLVTNSWTTSGAASRESMAMAAFAPYAAPAAQYVIAISVDGLGGAYLKKLFDGTATGGPYAIPNFIRLRNEGATTLTAHCDNDNWETLPNHSSMMTGRQQVGANGHNWTLNSDPAVGQTLHTNKGSYLASVFDVAHDNGLRTGMYANKTKFSLFHTYGSYTGGGSYDAANGAVDMTGVDNGRDKVDNTYIDTTLGGVVVDTYIAAQKSANPNQYAFLHINEPDSYGHGTGWGSATWNSQVVVVDTMLGKLLKLIEQDVPAMKGHTAIVLTADHGNQDNPPTPQDRYSVPFFVWGPGVTAGADLYTLNVGRRLVAASYPMTTYSGLQPVRNAEINNVALKLLGLSAIPGSTIGSAQDLVVTGAAPVTPPTVTLSLTGSPMAEAAGVATVTATLSAVSALPVTVNLAFSGTATLTSDYTRSATNIVIPAGSTTGSITLTAVQDAVYDPNETIIVDIDTVVNATENGVQQVTATIADDEVAPAYRSYTGTPIGENFDALGATGTSITALVGWDAGHFSTNPQQGTTGGTDLITVTDPLVVDDGSHDVGGLPILGNFGTTGSADRALGSFARTTPAGDQYLQLAIRNDTATPLASFTLSYRGEEWRNSNAAVQQLTLWYGNTNATNGFVSMGSSFTFNSPNNTGGNVAIDGNAAGNFTAITGIFTPASPIAPGSTFYIRWYDINDSGISDDFLAIDDVTVTPVALVPQPTVTLGLTGSPMAEAGGVATVTATLSAAYNQPVTVNLAFTGTATPTSDYTRSGTSIVIPAGSTTGSITLTAVQDAIYEYPYETIIVDIATVVNGTESGTQQVTAIITDDDPVPAGGYATRETFDSYTNGTLLSAISGWWTVGSYAVVSGGGVNGSPGIGTDGGQSHILNWQSQPFQWSTLPVSTKVAIGMDFQSSPAGTFDDDRVAWTVDAASDTTSANQCGLQIDTVSDGGMVVYWGGTKNVLNALSGIKVSTWYRFGVEYTKLSATSAQIIGTLTELDGSGNPVGTPYVGTVADSSTFANPVPAARFTSTYQWPSFKNYGVTAGNADNPTLAITPPPSVTLGLAGSPMAEAGGVATVTATLSAAHSQPVTVNLAFTGTATLTSDYTRSATSILIPAGSTTGSITLTAVPDAVYDPNETIIVDITTVVNGTENGTQQVTATINDPNRPPVFAGYAASGTTDKAMSIAAAKILAQASDPDADALSLTAVFGPSAHGGTVALAGDLNYTPPAGYAGTDTFDVQITDARGASVRGTVTITLSAPAAGQGHNLTDFTLHNGQADMVFRGIPGRSYTVQRSTDMVTWSDFATVTAGADGKISFTDPAPPAPSGFYRTKSN